MSRQLREYLSQRYDMPPGERRRQFAALARTFGPADRRTREYRARLRQAGVAVVFPSPGLTPDQVLAIIESSETQRILREVCGH